MVLKRFLKGLLASLGASAIAYAINMLPQMNLVSASSLSLITAFLLAIEKWMQMRVE